MKAILILAVVGLCLAIVVGAAANSQSASEKQFCDSVDNLQSSVTSLTSGGSPTKEELQSDLSDLKSAFGDVASDAKKLTDANISSLQNAWGDFKSSVQGVENASSLSDAEQTISQAASGLESAVRSTAKTYDCSSSGS